MGGSFSSDGAPMESLRKAAAILSGSISESGILNLQQAAKEAIFNVDIPPYPPMEPALTRICEVSRLMIGGATSSIIMRQGAGWYVGAACGAGAEKIRGKQVDAGGKSVTGYVISARQPYYFEDITILPELAGRENRNRTLGNGFISLPIMDHTGILMGVLNVAGLSARGEGFKARRDSIAGTLDAIALKLAKVREAESLFPQEDDPRSRDKADADKEKLLFMSIHDIKNSLTLIKANIYHLEQLNLGEEAGKIIELIKFGGERSLDLALSILDSRMMRDHKLRPNLRQLELAPFLTEMAKEFEVFAGRLNVRIGLDTAREGGARADRSLLRRMVGNLLDNALKHSPAGGQVLLGLAHTSNGTADIFVQDQGKGIMPDDRERIFDLYGGPGETSGGVSYGIGLAFCRLAARAQGGAIWVEPAPEKGSRFVIRLPSH